MMWCRCLPLAAMALLACLTSGSASCNSADSPRHNEVCAVMGEVTGLLHEAHTSEGAVAAGSGPAAANLAHYLSLRRHDLRALQQRLQRLGLSSLGSLESHVAPTLCAVWTALDGLRAEVGGNHSEGGALPPALCRDVEAFDAGAAELATRADRLLGAAMPRVMVTLPTAAATDSGLVREMVASGMTIARINCAHDGAAEWTAMAANVRAAAASLNRTVRLSFDMAGPKLRVSDCIMCAGCGSGHASPANSGARWCSCAEHGGSMVGSHITTPHMASISRIQRHARPSQASRIAPSRSLHSPDIADRTPATATWCCSLEAHAR